MTDHARNVLVGLFVLGSLVALGVLIVMFGEGRGLFSKQYEIHAHFEAVTGLREGSDVELAGIRVGSIEKITLRDRENPNQGVRVTLRIDQEYPIPAESTAVAMIPLMGQPKLNILPPRTPTPPLARDGSAVISGTTSNPLEQVVDPEIMETLHSTMKSFGDLARALTPAARSLDELLARRTIAEVEASTRPALTTQEVITANLSTAVQRLDNVLRHIESVLGDPVVQGDLKQTIANLKQASAQANLAIAEFHKVGEDARMLAADARGVVANLNGTIDVTRARVDELGRRLIASTDQVSKLLDYFTSAARDVAEGKGTIGMLLRDPKFYEELLLTVQRLGQAASELQVLIKQWQTQGLLGLVR